MSNSDKKEESKPKNEKLDPEDLQEQVEKSDLDDMVAYVDEYGNITDTPPDPSEKDKVKAENIEVSIPKKEEDDKVRDALHSGTVTYFNEPKGFGFILDSDTGESVFSHISDHIHTINENDRVTFKVEQGHKGPKAVEVKLKD